MHAVFYDLETSDKNPIGQILNYSFIHLDSDWKQVGELAGLIKISRLQIPDSGAILANRTNVLEHQEQAKDYEPAAMKRIGAFLASCIERAGGAVALVGFNSSRFDLNYLRTSLIRNGIDPYFSSKLIPRDVLHVVQKAYLASPEFRELIRKERAGEQKLSLSLQTVGHALGLLTGAQAHESRADVVLTIKVAEWLNQRCGLNVSTFEAYEGGKLHSTERTGAVYLEERPDYDLSAERWSVKTPVTVLSADAKAALWIDLERYADKQDPSCIMWRSAAKHAFFVSPTAVVDPELQRLARAAVGQFKRVTLRNFFGDSSCDVEQDIYRLDFDSRKLYNQCVESNDRSLLNDCAKPEAKILWTRRQLASPEASVADPKTAELLKRYAVYRYGGSLQLPRALKGAEREEGDFHATLGVMVQRLIQSRDAAALQGKREDVELLDALERFIKGSDIVKVAGKELIPMWCS